MESQASILKKIFSITPTFPRRDKKLCYEEQKWITVKIAKCDKTYYIRLWFHKTTRGFFYSCFVIPLNFALLNHLYGSYFFPGYGKPFCSSPQKIILRIYIPTPNTMRILYPWKMGRIVFDCWCFANPIPAKWSIGTLNLYKSVRTGFGG